ncbi:MAG: outer membrane protein assembly factor BamA [Proteobacteria bacterium]|nr:outer membrane protein assembly factor BamA [Pseudomonadota bacterium]MBU1716797.1 outer membrane protein assembly factor BamA [Pseudomonadota bacterium]
MFSDLNKKGRIVNNPGCRLIIALLAVIGVTCSSGQTEGAELDARTTVALTPPRHYQIRIIGNKALSKKELTKAAATELADAKKSGINPAQANDAAFQMESAYRQKGFAFAAVNYIFSENPGEKAPLVTFNIVEGPKVLIKELNLPGITLLSKHLLQPFFEEGQEGRIDHGNLIFVDAAIRSAISEMRDYYYREGFKDIAIEEPRYIFSPDQQSVKITIPVQEGLRYLIKNIEFNGDVQNEANRELAILNDELTKKPYFRRRELIVQSRIKEIYANLGFPDTLIKIESNLRPETGEVNLAAVITSGPQVTITALDLPENTKTKPSFIGDLILLKPGDTYSLAKKNQSFQELYKTGLFSRIELELVEDTSPENRRLQVKVEELPSKELSFEAGYGSYERLRFKTEVLENNLWGTGRRLKLSGSISLVGEKIETSITDPIWLGTEITAELPVYYLRREEPSFTRQEAGASVLFSRVFFDDWHGSLSCNIRSTKTLEVDPATNQDAQDTDYNLISTKIQTVIDRRNDIFRPSKGYRGYLAVEAAEQLLGSEVTFTRFTGGIRYFRDGPLNTVLAVRYALGFILPGSQNTSVPLAERFFNGGESSVRSFQESELGPHDLNGEPTGGLAYNTINLELRRHLTGNWAASFFIDFGNISPNQSRSEQGKTAYTDRSEVIDDTISNFFSDFRTGVGLGLQYLLPVGPIRLDYAINPDPNRERDERDWTLHLSVGMAF